MTNDSKTGYQSLNILVDQVLAPYTYMKTGGIADELVLARTTDELIEAITYAYENKRRFIIIGGGSNTLFSDQGYRGLVIINRTQNITVDTNNHTITASSGVPTNSLVNAANQAGLAGLAWFLGVPGSVGGAVYNNSHYQNHLIGDNLSQVEILDESLKRKTLTVDTLQLGYDYSRFHQTKEVILTATWQLKPGDPAKLKKRALSALEKRKQSQPLSLPSSGCMFQNPDQETQDFLKQSNLPTTAGALIDHAGLKNTHRGDAKVSEVHANFIVNTGQASSADIQELTSVVQETIFKKYHIHLKPEVFFINEYGERMRS